MNLDKENILKSFLGNKVVVIDKYFGAFDRDIIVKNLIPKLNTITKKYFIAQRKLTYVFIELAQNVGFYSDEKKEVNNKNIGAGGLLFFETPETLGFIIGNLINNKAFEVLKHKTQIINNMSREELRKLKRQQRNLIPGTNGNAHIGLIMVALTVKQPLDIFYKKINDNFNFFAIKVEVNKN